MDERIGTYENGRRVLPAKTIAGAEVKKPVHTTMDIAPGYFVVVDDNLPRKFDKDAVIAELQAGMAAATALPVEVTPGMPTVAEELSGDWPVKGRSKNAG